MTHVQSPSTSGIEKEYVVISSDKTESEAMYDLAEARGAWAKAKETDSGARLVQRAKR
jgi:hypothetical protein